MRRLNLQIARTSLLVSIALLAGCETMQTREPVQAGLDEMRTGKPAAPITKVVTGFTGALRCMDRQLADYGVKEIRLMVEDLNDKTSKVPAGTTDMFISAISQMTTRSRAINLKAFGDDTKNLSTFLKQAGTKGPFQPDNVPDFTVRGSISQFDDNIVKKNVDLGISLGDAKMSSASAGYTRSATGRELGMDLSVIRASDFSLVPGANAKNSMFIITTGSSMDAEIGYKKFGVSFLSSLTRNDGNARAVRNLVELSSIELLGRLLRVPYWRCLEIANDNPEVKAEIEDWHEGLWAGGASEVFAYYQHHLNTLGVLPKYERGKPDEDFKFALRVYKKALGLKPSGSVNLELFQTHLTADRTALWKAIEPLYKAELKERLMVKVTAVEPAPFKRGQIVNLSVAPNVPSHTACYLLDENNDVFRIWTSEPTPRLNADSPPAPIALPRGLLKTDTKGRPMQVTCFATRVHPATTPALQSPVGVQALSGTGPQKIPTAKSMRDVLAMYQASRQELSIDTLFIKAN